jgi:hypothetical protein
MARWKALPEGLDPIVVQFVVELRKMKDDSGLILDQLARRTGYSDSSWERYLGGRALAPAGAVRALIGIVGADETGVMVLHQAAQDAWAASGPPDAGAGTGAAMDEAVGEADADAGAVAVLDVPEEPLGEGSEAEPEEELVEAAAPGAAAPRSASRPRVRAVLNSVTSALTGAAVAVLLLQPWHHDPAPPAVTQTAPAEKAAIPARFTCTFSQTGGKWYAGNSATDTELVEYDMAGPEVAEVQCLLQHAGITPGGIDGRFGPKTLHAVILAQLKHNLDVDGQVGPHTWAALRG